MPSTSYLDLLSHVLGYISKVMACRMLGNKVLDVCIVDCEEIERQSSNSGSNHTLLVVSKLYCLCEQGDRNAPVWVFNNKELRGSEIQLQADSFQE